MINEYLRGKSNSQVISKSEPSFKKVYLEMFSLSLSRAFNVASNYFWINVYIKISPNQKYIISTVSKSNTGFPHFQTDKIPWYFHDISMIFIIFCKIPWFFQVYYIFPGFPVNVGTLINLQVQVVV